MKITDAFLGEHAVFYAQFDAVEACLGDLQTPGEVQVRGGVIAAALGSHAALEEDLLFTRLEPVLGKAGPLAAMRFEHNQIEEALLKLNTMEDPAKARDLLGGTIQLARAHFAKEERVLFRLADQSLPAEDLTSLGAEWARRRKVFAA